MLKLTPCPFALVERLVQIQPSALLLTLVACLGSFQFSDSVMAQMSFESIDSIEEDFVSALGAESDSIWNPALSQVSLSESDCCSEILEPSSLKQNRALCTIKCALGGTEIVEIRPKDELWIVSARDCDASIASAESLDVKRLKNNFWQTTSLGELANCHRRNPALTTLVYTHGNRTDYDYGISRGVQFYRNLTSCPEADGAIRMVLWLWKSEKESVRLYKDFLTKSQRAVEMGAAFQTTLERLGDSRVALVGFSLGTQVILSALDLMQEKQATAFLRGEGASSQGRCSDGAFTEKYKVAFIAPALDPAYACAATDRTVCSSLADQTRIFSNRSDRALAAMRIVIRRECPQKSISFKKLIDQQRLNLGQVKQIDLTVEVGPRHSIQRYSRTPALCCEIGGLLSKVANAKILANLPVPSNQFAVE